MFFQLNLWNVLYVIKFILYYGKIEICHHVAITEKAERSHKGDSAVGVPFAGTVANAELGDASQLIYGEQE